MADVVVSDGLVVKTFAAAEVDAWAREVAGLRAVGALVGSDDVARSVTTRWVEGVVPFKEGLETAALHRSLGGVLWSLHQVSPTGLAPWSVVERLRARLSSPPSTCPVVLAGQAARLVEPWTTLMVDDGFVHGDWGTSNVIVDPAAPSRVRAVIDFEDAHVGDPAEDFKWQVLAGVRSDDQLLPMVEGYQLAGGRLWPHGAERMALAGAELCLDVLGWELPADQAARYHGRAIATLEELVAGELPEPP